MVAIDRLREVATRVEDGGCVSPGGGCLRKGGVTCRTCLADALYEIADQAEAEHNVSDREEHDAIAWVREHGGIAYVKEEWRRRSNLARQLERAQAKVERQQRHIEDVQGKLTERNERIAELERNLSKSVSGQPKADAALYDLQRGVLDVCKAYGIEAGDDPLRAIDDVLDRRLVPEGMEWPRYEDGEPVMFGDRVYHEDEGAFFTVENVEIRQDGWHALSSANGLRDVYRPNMRVKRPAPKALDADGVEVREGDVLYRKSDGRMVEVAEVYEKTFIDADDCVRPGDGFTHRAPVFAADGIPLREGETVWEVETGDGYVVERIYSGTTEPDFPGHTVACRRPDDVVTHMFKPSQLTHRAPILAADGEPLEVGQTVWHVSNGIQFTVVGLPKSGEYQAVKLRFDDGAFTGLDPDQLTHQCPVLDADGVPIHESDTVWCVATDDEFKDMGILTCKDKVRQRLTVRRTFFSNGEPWVDFCETFYSVRACYLTHQRPVLDADGVPIKVGDTVWEVGTVLAIHMTVVEVSRDTIRCEYAWTDGKVYRPCCSPDTLTHTKPEIDTWQRIEEDAGCTATKYNDRRGTIFTTKQQVARDLVRRCRALAERERGE